MPLLRTAALAAFAAGLLAGCGPEPDTLPRREIRSPDQSWAERTELEASDFPAGWRATPPEEEAGRRATGCDEIDYSDLTLTGEASGDSFFDGERLLALSATQVYADPEDARAAVERGTSEESVGCTEHAFRDTVTKIDEGFDIADLVVREGDPPAAGASARAFEIVLDYEVDGERVPGFFDIYVVQRDRAVVALFLGGVERFPAALTTSILERVDERLQADPPLRPAAASRK